MATVLTEQGEFDVATAGADGEDLWLAPRHAAEITGWLLKPEGLCKGEICVPLPSGREQEFVRAGRINLGELWRHLGHPVAHSARGDAWVLAQSARERSASRQSLMAPDFTLPDVAGRQHSLSDQRGKKVLLVTWASW